MLRIYSYTWNYQLYMYGLEIIPSKGDYNHTSGIFGNSNGDSSDDLVYLRNTTSVANSLDEFFESFK